MATLYLIGVGQPHAEIDLPRHHAAGWAVNSPKSRAAWASRGLVGELAGLVAPDEPAALAGRGPRGSAR
jgi:hypothetical protein